MPVCTKCKADKSESEFSKEPRKANGLNSHCKVCKNIARKKWYGPTTLEKLQAENASLKEQVAQTEFRNERLLSDYASVQEELSTVRRIHVQNIAIKDAEIARWKTVPMKYRRMEFNAQLQDENAELSKKLTTLQSKSAVLVDALEGSIRTFERIDSKNNQAAEMSLASMKDAGIDTSFKWPGGYFEDIAEMAQGRRGICIKALAAFKGEK